MTAPLLIAAISSVILAQSRSASRRFWRLQHGEATPLPIRSDDVAAIATGAWAGWREFRVEINAFEDHIRTQRS